MKKIKLSKNMAHTWFIDLDGTIVKHNGYIINKKDILLKGVKKFFKQIPKKDKIIINDKHIMLLMDSQIQFQDIRQEYVHQLYQLKVYYI